MTLRDLVLILTLSLISCDADSQDPGAAHCDDCNHSGRWWPLFKPSQILHSEFPEHAERKAEETEYGHGLFQLNSVEQPARLVNHGSPEVGGFDSEVKTFNSQGKHRLEWDHYGDVSHVSTVPYNSLEVRREDGGVSHGSAEVTPEKVASEEKEQEEEEKGVKDISKTSVEDFFDDRHFFREEFSEPKNVLSKEFEISKESSYSQESSKSLSTEISKEVSSRETFSNENKSQEEPKKPLPLEEEHEPNKPVGILNTHETISRYNKPSVATSYSAFSSVFTRSKPVNLRSKDLLHPDLAYGEVSNYIQSPRSSPVSRSQFFNGFDVTKQYLVHEDHPEDVLRINPLVPVGGRVWPEFRYSPLAPQEPSFNHYVKNHGGLLHYRHYPNSLSRSSSLRWQDVRPELRGKFPFKQMQPHVHVQRHETRVRHVIPGKDSTQDSLWKENRRMETFKPPPLGQDFFLLKKKPHVMDLKKTERNKGSSVVYIIKTNKRIG